MLYLALKHAGPAAARLRKNRRAVSLTSGVVDIGSSSLIADGASEGSSPETKGAEGQFR